VRCAAGWRIGARASDGWQTEYHDEPQAHLPAAHKLTFLKENEPEAMFLPTTLRPSR
jgi:hypothetical protein